MHEKVFIFDDICHKFTMVMSLLWNGMIFLINEELNAELLQRTKWWSVFDKFTINQKVSKFLQFLIQALHEQNVNSHSFQHIKKKLLSPPTKQHMDMDAGCKKIKISVSKINPNSDVFVLYESFSFILAAINFSIKAHQCRVPLSSLFFPWWLC